MAKTLSFGLVWVLVIIGLLHFSLFIVSVSIATSLKSTNILTFLFPYGLYNISISFMYVQHFTLRKTDYLPYKRLMCTLFFDIIMDCILVMYFCSEHSYLEGENFYDKSRGDLTQIYAVLAAVSILAFAYYRRHAEALQQFENKYFAKKHKLPAVRMGRKDVWGSITTVRLMDYQYEVGEKVSILPSKKEAIVVSRTLEYIDKKTKMKFQCCCCPRKKKRAFKRKYVVRFMDEEKVECVYEEKICPVFSMTITSAPNRTPSFSVPTIYKIRDRIPSSSPASNVTF